MIKESNASSNKNNTTTASNGTKTCHWLPCSIDYDGYAPIHMHFRPEQITHITEETQKNEEETHKSSTAPSSKHVQAVSFRGRGLLANDDDTNTMLPQNIIGSVMIPSSTKQTNAFNSSSDNNYEDTYGTVVMKETFEKVSQWEHESNEMNLMHSEDSLKLKDVQSPSSVGRSIGMFEILRAVHDPIPIPSED